uniref:Uncharacterized protein n=1 Tax=Arundo donax TaxID=35708 RepID=A0A0A9ARP5_ARUDO
MFATEKKARDFARSRWTARHRVSS